ncbi:MAG: hypothetical protein KDJ47_11500 [Hyphomicrobiaceae bacterium]|nr:hypothetical protein [Hyphomicrobiaceae bacterium]
MYRLTDNELAMLELLIDTPRSCIPPMHLNYAKSLSRRGLATYSPDGRWYVTAAGVRETNRCLH